MNEETSVRKEFTPCLPPRMARHLGDNRVACQTGTVISVSAPGHCDRCGAPRCRLDRRLSYIRLQTKDPVLEGGSP